MQANLVHPDDEIISRDLPLIRMKSKMWGKYFMDFYAVIWVQCITKRAYSTENMAVPSIYLIEIYEIANNIGYFFLDNVSSNGK